MRARATVPCAALICAALAFSPAQVRAAESAEPAAAEPADRIDDDAVALFASFGDALKAQPKFSFAVELSYEVVQEDGQKLEFGSSRTYTVRRPDRLRIDEVRRTGGARTIFFDGEQLAVYVPDDKAYALAKLKQHRSLDEAIELLRGALDIQIPLGDLLRANPLIQIEEHMNSAYVVGRETLSGVECDHVAWRTDEINAEAWFTTAAQPLLHRVVINYRDLEGQPTFRAQFTNWNRSPDVSDAVFVFAPPDGVERIRFSVRGRDLQPAEEQTP